MSKDKELVILKAEDFPELTQGVEPATMLLFEGLNMLQNIYAAQDELGRIISFAAVCLGPVPIVNFYTPHERHRDCGYGNVVLRAAIHMLEGNFERVVVRVIHPCKLPGANRNVYFDLPMHEEDYDFEKELE